MFDDLKNFTGWFCCWLVVAMFISALASISPLGRDDSDPGQWGRRSNIMVRTDALTGCQYLEGRGGGITPRLDGEARHVGCKK